ncbi:hypothetical protein HY256_05865, partial [Candidatus Sumerlaeota bacterium]|nr:hypothetical protein [Candidatus Sumerlaeota bacterium]
MLFENKGELLFHFTEVNKKDRMEIDLPSRPSVRQAIERPKSAWIADLDGDGKSDVVLNFKNHLQILRAK